MSRDRPHTARGRRTSNHFRNQNRSRRPFAKRTPDNDNNDITMDSLVTCTADEEEEEPMLPSMHTNNRTHNNTNNKNDTDTADTANDRYARPSGRSAELAARRQQHRHLHLSSDLDEDLLETQARAPKKSLGEPRRHQRHQEKPQANCFLHKARVLQEGTESTPSSVDRKRTWRSMSARDSGHAEASRRRTSDGSGSSGVSRRSSIHSSAHDNIDHNSGSCGSSHDSMDSFLQRQWASGKAAASDTSHPPKRNMTGMTQKIPRKTKHRNSGMAPLRPAVDPRPGFSKSHFHSTKQRARSESSSSNPQVAIDLCDDDEDANNNSSNNNSTLTGNSSDTGNSIRYSVASNSTLSSKRKKPPSVATNYTAANSYDNDECDPDFISPVAQKRLQQSRESATDLFVPSSISNSSRYSNDPIIDAEEEKTANVLAVVQRIEESAPAIITSPMKLFSDAVSSTISVARTFKNNFSLQKAPPAALKLASSSSVSSASTTALENKMMKSRRGRPQRIEPGQSLRALHAQEETAAALSSESRSVGPRRTNVATHSTRQDDSGELWEDHTLFDKEPVPNRPIRSATRSKRSNKKDDKEVIDIASSGDETAHEQLVLRPKKLVARRQLEAVRVAIGKLVFDSDCKVRYQIKKNLLEVKYKERPPARRTRGSLGDSNTAMTDSVLSLNLDDDLLQEIKYNLEGDVDVDDAEVPIFLALRIKKTSENKLDKLSNKYKPDGTDLQKKYIVIEFRSDQDLQSLLDLMKKNTMMEAYLTLCRLDPSKADQYCKSLAADSKLEQERRLTSVSLSSPLTSGFLNGRKETDLLLEFPFAGDPDAIDRASQGLGELSCVLAAAEQSARASTTTSVANDQNGDSSDTENDVSTSKSRALIQISVDDYSRTLPGVYWNDSLIDFFAKWIWRNVDYSAVHVFTSHFYTHLEEMGPSGVASWTKRWDIDIFSKRFIFIPINKALHWSLCIVVNPGAIKDHIQLLDNYANGDQETQDVLLSSDEDVPCLLFFDALKAHKKVAVRKNIEKWLNAEWNRLHPDDDSKNFTAKTIKIYTPTIPYQKNSWDCGVFVCRYMYSIYLLRHEEFTYNSTDVLGAQETRFKRLITESDAFQFGMDDIARLRREMMTLLERLSEIFIPWKTEQDRIRKQERLAKKIESESSDDADEQSRVKENVDHNENTFDTPSSLVPNRSSGVRRKDEEVLLSSSIAYLAVAEDSDQESTPPKEARRCGDKVFDVEDRSPRKAKFDNAEIDI